MLANKPGRGWDVRLVPVAATAWAGAYAGLSGPLAGTLGLVLVSSCAAALVLTGRGVRGAHAAVLLFTFAVAALVGMSSKIVFDEDPLNGVSPGGLVRVVGEVLTDPAPTNAKWGSPGALKVTLLLESRGRVTLQTDLEGVTRGGLNRGAIIRAEGKFERFEEMSIPYLGVIKADSFEVIKEAPLWLQWAIKLKTALYDLTNDYGGEYGSLIRGMAVGDDRGLPDTLKEAMLTGSLTHLTAVSGSHIGIALVALRLVLPANRKVTAAGTLVFLVIVVVVVGPTSSVIRAVSMGALAAWGTVMRRGGQSLQLLSAVTIATVLISPWSALSLGFALSTTATFGILTLGQLLRKIWGTLIPERAPLKKLWVTLVDAVSIALSAQIATLPVLALINPWLPTWGVAANLLVAPLVPALTLLGLSAAALVLLAPSLSIVFIRLASPLASALAHIAILMAEWPLARMPWPQGPLGFAAALVWVAPFVALVALTGEWRLGLAAYRRGNSGYSKAANSEGASLFES